MANTIYVLNGPNLNLLGTRQPETYGHTTLADVEQLCRSAGKRFDLAVEFRQSNLEGELVTWIQQAKGEFDQFVTPDTGRKFTEVYNVQHLASNQLDSVARVTICTIQRL